MAREGPFLDDRQRHRTSLSKAMLKRIWTICTNDVLLSSWKKPAMKALLRTYNFLRSGKVRVVVRS